MMPIKRERFYGAINQSLKGKETRHVKEKKGYTMISGEEEKFLKIIDKLPTAKEMGH